MRIQVWSSWRELTWQLSSSDGESEVTYVTSSIRLGGKLELTNVAETHGADLGEGVKKEGEQKKMKTNYVGVQNRGLFLDIPRDVLP